MSVPYIQGHRLLIISYLSFVRPFIFLRVISLLISQPVYMPLFSPESVLIYPENIHTVFSQHSDIFQIVFLVLFAIDFLYFSLELFFFKFIK